MGRATLRSLKVVVYAALLGILLASYVAPLQDMVSSRPLIAGLQNDISELEKDNASRRRAVEELQTPEGIERAARERYGMIEPGEQVFVVPGDRE